MCGSIFLVGVCSLVMCVIVKYCLVLDVVEYLLIFWVVFWWFVEVWFWCNWYEVGRDLNLLFVIMDFVFGIDWLVVYLWWCSCNLGVVFLLK